MINVFYIFPRNKIQYSLFNGSFYYIVEYFLYLHFLNADINFYIICNKNLKNETEKKFKEYFSIRYNVNFPEKNIHYITELEMYFLKNKLQNTTIIVDTETFKNKYLQSSLDKNNNIHLIYTARYLETVQECKKILSELNIFHYNENDKYNKKIYFDILKKPEKEYNKNFISLKEFRSITINQFNSIIIPFIKTLENKKTIILTDVSSNLSKFINKNENIEIHYKALPNLFEMFNVYIDCMLNNFDYSPRMLLECFYLGKKVYYINNNKNDNAFKRYNDILNNDIKKYFLNDDDILIKRCLNV